MESEVDRGREIKGWRGRERGSEVDGGREENRESGRDIYT